ncbi:DUF2390 domain-containing protein [Shewanella sp. YIC-542]|uniref:DUF2390 domain-containing protein n=1 Tax=Shewanella mytili TaxID=3377111 RepID=UPI00398EB937
MSLHCIFTPTFWQGCEQHFPFMETLAQPLREQYGIIINLLMLALELDRQQLLLNNHYWQQLQQTLTCWQEHLLLPYRQLRHLARQYVDESAYEQMLEVEQLLERQQQQVISLQLWDVVPTVSRVHRANLHSYLALFHLNYRDFPELTQISRYRYTDNTLAIPQ